MIVGLTVISLVFIMQRSSYLSKIQLQTENDIYSYSQDFESKITEISSDVFLIKQMIMTRDSFEIVDNEVRFTSPHELERIKVSLMDWMLVKTIYDQIRVIDIDGNEMVRVNYNNGSPEIVADDLLQNKSGRYYFENSIILDENNLYVSKLDLNIENNQIEVVDGETKKMLRLATTLFNENNEKIGVLVVNYLAKDLLDSADSLNFSEHSNFEVLNNDGFYLKSLNPELEFTFMYDQSEHIQYSDKHSFDVLSNSSSIMKQESYDNQLYTYLSITEESLSEKITSVLGENITVVNETERFIIVGEVSLNQLVDYRAIATTTIIMAIFYVITILVITRLIDNMNYYRNEQLRTLEYTANHDPLTKLPNRNKLFNDINYKLSRNKDLAILFMDFDGFKKINDNYDHDIGDLALIKGVQRIKEVIRQDDLLARVGGDEFVVVLFDMKTEKDVKTVISKISNNFKTPFNLKNNNCSMGVSIGYSLSKKGSKLDDLLKEADAMMYINKEAAKAKKQ